MAELNSLSVIKALAASYWRMEGNSNDSIGSNNGTDNNITYNTGNGKYGQGAGLVVASSSRIQLPDNAFNTAMGGDFSVSAWIKPSTLNVSGGNGGAIFSNYHYEVHGYGFALDLKSDNSGKISLTIGKADNTFITLNSIGAVDTTKFWHILLTRKLSTRSRIYINGILDNSNADTNNPLTGITINPAIGVHRYGPSAYEAYFPGAIDDVAFFTSELTAAQALQLFNEGTGFLALMR